MNRLPEGMRRLCSVIGALLAVWWLIAIGFLSRGFTEVQPQGWALLAAGLVVAYHLPGMIYRIYGWVRDGFKVDANR
ncbi:hypothetical protein ALP03_200271 [Pseudomonas amygdali pv. tabaci]|uniref:DUF2842 domain-containing protein n=1 Tax=Pseudomonas amygdali pv. tabaci TaxID=322 RepID=A0A3M6HS77_PSEAJ|nr:hypothetical protein ALP03_200271 [Pseudomonas amygdali pv. tabaci]